MSARIACPMCGLPLNRGTVEEINIEFSTLNTCGRCGFGLDLRWRGRGSVFARPTPDLVIVSPQQNISEQLTELLPDQLTIEQVGEPMDALGVCARAVRRETPLKALVILSRGLSERWSDVAVAVRSLEEGFRVQSPVPIWYVSSIETTPEEQEIFSDLSEIYWYKCEQNQEVDILFEMAPQLFR